MKEFLNIATAPKTGTFQMRINLEIKEQVERIYANCGLTLTEAINIFLQQSLNAGGMPFLITQNSKETLHWQAVSHLTTEQKTDQTEAK